MAKLIAYIFAFASLLTLVACTNIGPQTIPRDRFDYNAAISDSWKEQTLLNIVKVRYADMPLFVDVASVVSGYTLESNVSVSAESGSDGGIRGDVGRIGGSAKFTDRPTITYAPITGSQFNKSFMTPIPPSAVLFLIQAGWPADMIIPLTVDSMNGLQSHVTAGDGTRIGDSQFYRAIEILRDIQLAGATGMQLKSDDETGDTALFIIHSSGLTPRERASTDELRSILKVSANASEFDVEYGFLPENERQIAVITRSMLQIMSYLAGQVDVPSTHIASGRTVAGTLTNITDEGGYRVQIQHSEEEPEGAFVAVRYHDIWYYIDDTDYQSKRQFSFVMLLMSLMESGDNTGLPLVTIPAG